jgi:ribosome biogenesis GTPase
MEPGMSLEDLGWSSFFSQHLDFGEANVVPGRVSSQHGQLFRAFTQSGELVCDIAGRLRSEAINAADLPAVGDWVVIRPRELLRGTIHSVLPRRTKLSRRAAGIRNEEQIIAANVDMIFIVTALDQDFTLRRIERYLSITIESGADPVIILNKCDLAEEFDSIRAKVEGIAGDAPVHLVSAATLQGIDRLRGYLQRGRTAVFVGSSGVGKSTLVNALFGTEVQSTRNVRMSDSKGRHTTTYRRLIPLQGGGMLVDTPGMREVQLWASEDCLESSFADITEAARQCRFRDCTHQHEPGCAVRAQIDSDRLESFHKQQKELAHLDRQINMQAAQAEKQRWKTIHKAMRDYHPRG